MRITPWTGADEEMGETVGPFPQEPAQGSAQAVEQAAEAIRRLDTYYFPSAVNGGLVRVFLGIDDDQPYFDQHGDIRLSRVLGAEILRLAGEVERLRRQADVADAHMRGAYEARDTVRNINQILGRDLETAERQRDSLADALEEALAEIRSLAVEEDDGTIYLCEDIALGSSLQSTREAIDQAEEALRSAGRLS